MAVMIILLLGKPGSGKGTQAKLLVDKFGLYYFATGDFSRNLAKNDPRVAEIVSSGKLIPEDEMTDHVIKFLEEKQSFLKNILFEGFPRYVTQYQKLEEWLGGKGFKFDFVFLIDVSDEEVVRRLSARRIDKNTGKIYNLITEPPGADVDPKNLEQRSDDSEETIKKRLEVFNENTLPTIEYAQKVGKLVKIDGGRSIDEIQKDLVTAIEDKLKNEASSN